MKKHIANINSTQVEGFGFLVMAIGLFAYSLINHGLSKTEWKQSPYLFPLVLSVFLGFLSISLLHEGNQLLKTGHQEVPDTTNWKTVGMITVFSLSYVLLIAVIRFVPATFLFLLVAFWYLGERKRHLIALLSIGFPIILYVLFCMLLHVMLP